MRGGPGWPAATVPAPEASRPPGQSVGTLSLIAVDGSTPRASVLKDDGRRAKPTWTSRRRPPSSSPPLPTSGGPPTTRPAPSSAVIASSAGPGYDGAVTWCSRAAARRRGRGLLANLIAVEIVLSVLAVGAAALIGRSLVERSLRPLNRVAATAQQVSQLPLDRGEVALAVRVPPADTNPDSEVGRVGLALNHMLNNVEEALAARQASETKVRQFVADASHELRNPLAAIRGYAELTQRSGEEIPPDAAYAMSRVESEADRMSQLVEDLLLLARLDAGPALDIQPTDLNALLIDAVSDARAAGPDHSWSLSLPDELVTVPADQFRLHQVVANLLANARTHTPAGTRVEAALTTAGDRALITVSDNGPGIAAGDRGPGLRALHPGRHQPGTRRRRAPGPAPASAWPSSRRSSRPTTAPSRCRAGPGETRFVVSLPLDAGDRTDPRLRTMSSSEDSGVS